MEKEPSCSYLVRIEGRVQGVWYRGWTEQQAKKKGPFRMGEKPARWCSGSTSQRTRIWS